MTKLAAVLAFVGVATMAAAQEIETERASVVTSSEVIETSRAVLPEGAETAKISSNCSGGVVYDDGVFNDAYSIGDGDPGDATMVMKFDLPAGTTKLDQVCNCFTRNASAPSSMSYEVVVYDDNGPSGQPGTFLGSVNASASSIPIFGATQFYNVNMTSSPITLPDTHVYIGARWLGDSVFMCGDRSAGTTQRSSYGSGNLGGSWTNMTALFPTSPPRAMGIRTDPKAVVATCTPSSTALCLNNDRFKVEAIFQQAGQPADIAHVVELTDETGYLWFFSAVNVEAVLKVINACPFNNRFWVFAGGLTDVRVDIVVTDTKTGTIKTYTNPQGKPFQPIQDTSAFSTCP